MKFLPCKKRGSGGARTRKQLPMEQFVKKSFTPTLIQTPSGTSDDNVHLVSAGFISSIDQFLDQDLLIGKNFGDVLRRTSVLLMVSSPLSFREDLF